MTKNPGDFSVASASLPILKSRRFLNFQSVVAIRGNSRGSKILEVFGRGFSAELAQ